MDTRPDTIKTVASYYGIEARKLQRHYKHKVSGYKQWKQYSHSDEYMLYPENISENLSIDEVSLSQGELYTVITNKKKNNKNKQCLVALINGTESKTIQKVLEQIPLEKRKIVKEVSMDMARNMSLAIENSFPQSNKVIDRFHVVKLIIEALQHLRVKFRWAAIEQENIAIKQAKIDKVKYSPEILSNGDTIKELLARSRYLLYKYDHDWTENQTKRANILFEKYPLLQKAYKLTLRLRNMYNNHSKSEAIAQFYDCKSEVETLNITEFNSVIGSIEYHFENIFKYFDNKSTNAYAESFNSKIKCFRTNLRGVTDIKFFLFRLEKLFA